MVAPWLMIIAPRIVCNSLFLPKKMCAKPYIFIRKFAENVKRWKQADSIMPHRCWWMVLSRLIRCCVMIIIICMYRRVRVEREEVAAEGKMSETSGVERRAENGGGGGGGEAKNGDSLPLISKVSFLCGHNVALINLSVLYFTIC